MNVQCPVCQAVYRIDPGRIPPGGVRAGCARCNAAFPIGEARGVIEAAAVAATGAVVAAGSGVRRTVTAAPAAPVAGTPSEAPAFARPPRSDAGSPARAGMPRDMRGSEAGTAGSGTAAPPERDAGGRGEPAAAAQAAGASHAPPAPERGAPAAPPVAPAVRGVPGTEPGEAPGAREGRLPLPGAGAAYAAGEGGSQAGAARRPAASPPPRPSPFGTQDPNARARRIARALVSDIVAYNRARRDRSLTEGTIRADFREEIMKSWNEYVEQVGEELARSTPHFRESLNEILAQGREVF
jgi:predicted Zn finger-like uncharacterized protein